MEDCMPLMEISIVPLGTKTASVSQYVAKAAAVLKKEKGVRYQLASMGTVVEADTVEKLLKIAGRMHRAVFSEGVKRVVTTIKLDERKDKQLTMEGKIKSVTEKIF
jgi:uncharacterized protein (TIGR00106 family)